MSDETISENIARHFGALRLEDIPGSVVAAAKLHILDSLGCLLAGTHLAPGRVAYELARAVSGAAAETTLIGAAERASYGDAVQAMSTAAHCGEVDDIHAGAGACIGALVMPSLLAMAERYGGTGRRMIEATVAGYEVIIRAGLAIDAPRLFARGWWPSTLCGAVGVAAAGARFLDWPVEKTVNALGIACLQAGGMLTGGGEGATARHWVFGRAAQNGILALVAAAAGFTGPRRVFEDPRGFCLTLCAEPRWQYLRDFDSWRLPDVAFKPYPCARQLHAAVEALLTLLEQHGVHASAIEAIECGLPAHNAAMMNRPTTPAMHAASVGSGQYVMAVAALRGKVYLASFEDEWLRSDTVRRLMAKVTVVACAELDQHFPMYWPGRVTVRIDGGRSFTREVIVPKGESGNPMSAREIEDKFLSLTTPIIGSVQGRAAISEVDLLDSRATLGPLLAALRPAPGD